MIIIIDMQLETWSLMFTNKGTKMIKYFSRDTFWNTAAASQFVLAVVVVEWLDGETLKSTGGWWTGNCGDLVGNSLDFITLFGVIIMIHFHVVHLPIMSMCKLTKTDSTQCALTKPIAFYGSSVRFGGCTELQGRYGKIALALITDAVHYMIGLSDRSYRQ